MTDATLALLSIYTLSTRCSKTSLILHSSKYIWILNAKTFRIRNFQNYITFVLLVNFNIVMCNHTRIHTGGHLISDTCLFSCSQMQFPYMFFFFFFFLVVPYYLVLISTMLISMLQITRTFGNSFLVNCILSKEINIISYYSIAHILEIVKTVDQVTCCLWNSKGKISRLCEVSWKRVCYLYFFYTRNRQLEIFTHSFPALASGLYQNSVN